MSPRIGKLLEANEYASTNLTYDGRYITRTIEVKRKLHPRRYYIYVIDKYKSVVIVARSVSDADIRRDYISKITRKYPQRVGVESGAKRVRVLMKDCKGKGADNAYGVFFFRNVRLNRRKVNMGDVK